jgi:hypothetical protein
MILEGMEYEVEMIRKLSKERAKLYEGYELATLLGVKGVGDCEECNRKKSLEYGWPSGSVMY